MNLTLTKYNLNHVKIHLSSFLSESLTNLTLTRVQKGQDFHFRVDGWSQIQLWLALTDFKLFEDVFTES